MIGLAGHGRWLVFMSTLILFNLVTSALCMLIGLVTTSNAVSNAAGSLMVLFSLLFAGYLKNPSDLPTGWLWFSWFSPSFYGYNALIENELAESPDLYITTVIGSDKQTAGPFSGRTILDCFDLGNSTVASYNSTMAMGFVGLLLVIYLVMDKVLKERR
mmetsp:Transcript_68689/g.191584  ORF Transcript_68689/g.191584 Transcript_68689/m.191584 type:complete len:159 (-) Transcript_68689:680-1156(-)